MNQRRIEELEVKRIEGGILVARMLVHAHAKDSSIFAETAGMARYAQLLAGRLQLPPVQSEKTVLVAWLSALLDHPELIDPLSQEHHLEDMLDVPDEFVNPECPDMGIQVLSLVAGYQELRREQPSIERDLNAVRRQLRANWAVSSMRSAILGKFMLILRDEQFLLSAEAPVGKILIVDPAEVVNSVISIPLRNRGFDTCVVGNAPEAEAALAEFKPDVILVELDMPIDGGRALCAALKEKPETQGIPILMLTSRKSQRVARECLKAGAEDVILRPVDMELLFIKLNKLLAVRPAKPLGAMAGSLSEIMLSDLIQILCAGLRSMRVILTRDGTTGYLYLRDGNIVAADVAALSGEMAFYELMRWKSGAFSAESCQEFPDQTIDAPTMSLLMEAARRNDEGVSPGPS